MKSAEHKEILTMAIYVRGISCSSMQFMQHYVQWWQLQAQKTGIATDSELLKC